PVYRTNLDRIVGMYHAFDVLKARAELLPPLRPVAYAPSDTRCNDLLFRMLRARLHLAVVHDEHGHTIGIATLENLLEELVGVIGPPGAGKSTLTAGLVAGYRRAGLTVGVIAVDPTSPFTGGALLGDRIRMESVALDPGVFIRSMATRGSLGGLAEATGEVADVLDAFGTDRIIIETVGVGQSELDVSRHADSTVVVLVPESGDSIQT